MELNQTVQEKWLKLTRFIQGEEIKSCYYIETGESFLFVCLFVFYFIFLGRSLKREKELHWEVWAFMRSAWNMASC